MNIQQLKVFVETMRGKTLTEVAAELKLKQPTVSFHLRKLEKDLGLELFHKPVRSIQPTEAGRSLLPYARKIVSLIEEARLLMDVHREKINGRLRLGASYTPATYLLPPFLADFQERYPQVLLTLTVKKAEDILNLLQNYEIDAGIVSIANSKLDGLVVFPLMEDELVLLLSPDHPLAAKEHVEVRDIEDESFLLHETGSTSRSLVEAWASEIGFTPQIKMELGSIETIKVSLKFNMGIGILPKRSVLEEVGAGKLIMRNLPEYVNHRYICLVYRNEEILASHVLSFLEYIHTIVLQTEMQSIE